MVRKLFKNLFNLYNRQLSSIFFKHRDDFLGTVFSVVNVIDRSCNLFPGKFPFSEFKDSIWDIVELNIWFHKSDYDCKQAAI